MKLTVVIWTSIIFQSSTIILRSALIFPENIDFLFSILTVRVAVGDASIFWHAAIPTFLLLRLLFSFYIRLSSINFKDAVLLISRRIARFEF